MNTSKNANTSVEVGEYAVTFGALNVGQAFRIYRKGETAWRQKVSQRAYVDFAEGPNGQRRAIKASAPVVRIEL